MVKVESMQAAEAGASEPPFPASDSLELNGERPIECGKGFSDSPPHAPIPNFPRGQSAVEYVTLMALVFVLVAALMLVSFRQQEVTLALSAARLSCIELSAENASFSCYEVRYVYVGAQNVTITPITNALAPEQKTALRNKIVTSLAKVFHASIQAEGSCTPAAYYAFCVEVP